MKINRRRKVFYIVFGVTAALILAAMTASLFIFPEKAYSLREKRLLEHFPEFSLESVISGRFMSGIEDFAKDQFVGRDYAVAIRTKANELMGNREANGVFLMTDGRLAERFTEPADAAFNETLGAVKTFSAAHEGADYYFLLAPTAVSVYEEKLPAYAETGSQDAYIDRVYASLPEDMTAVDVREVFQREKGRIELFYRTDHHWTTEGAKLAAAALLLKMERNVSVPEESGTVSASFVGSLAAKSGFTVSAADEITVYKIAQDPENEFYFTVTYADEHEMSASFYSAKALSGNDPYEVFFGGTHAEIDIQTSLETGRKLLMFKDSYANALIPFLANSFDEIVIVDPRYYRGDIDLLMEEKEFTDVVFLYNANILAEDTSLAMVLRNEQ